MNNRPRPISDMPCSSPARLTRDAPSTRRQADHSSSSFLRRMKRLKLMPHTTLLDFMKFSVEKGIAMVAVQPCAVLRAAEVHTPSQPEPPPPVPDAVRCA